MYSAAAITVSSCQFYWWNYQSYNDDKSRFCVSLSPFILFSELLVMTVATNANHDGYQQFLDSCNKHGLKLEVRAPLADNLRTHLNQ